MKMPKIKLPSKKSVVKVLILALTATICGTYREVIKSDQYIRNRIVKLISEKGQCSGEQVRAPSGKDYILSAGHCKAVLSGDSFTVISEQGVSIQRKLIAEDPNSDLLLIEGLPNLRGLDLADYTSRFEHGRSFTHGKGLDTYSTSGIYIQKKQIEVPVSQIETLEDELDCTKMNKNKVLEVDAFYYIIIKYCVMSVFEDVTSISIVPGSSGGAIVNDYGNLIGVASASDGFFGYMVPLESIRPFLAGY